MEIAKKKLSVAGLAMMLVFSLDACKPNLDRFEGTYVFEGKSEYSVVSDTLEVSLQSGTLFKIECRKGFNLLSRDGKPGERQYETEHWSAVYDENLKVLLESGKGKLIALDGEVLQVGKRKYKKIK